MWTYSRHLADLPVRDGVLRSGDAPLVQSSDLGNGGRKSAWGKRRNQDPGGIVISSKAVSGQCTTRRRYVRMDRLMLARSSGAIPEAGGKGEAGYRGRQPARQDCPERDRGGQPADHLSVDVQRPDCGRIAQPPFLRLGETADGIVIHAAHVLVADMAMKNSKKRLAAFGFRRNTPGAFAASPARLYEAALIV